MTARDPRPSFARSFFTRAVVDRRSTPHNRVLEVVHVRGRLILNAASVNYSFGSLHRVFEDAFALLRIEDRRVSRALILGFGAGSVADILRRLFEGRCRITGVEIDPEVIDIHRAWFAAEPSPDLEVHCADAAAFVRTSRDCFDLVVVDVFVDDRVPDSVQTPEFLRATAGLLAPGGLLVFNRIAHTDAAREESRRFATVFRETLGAARELEVRTNLVLAHERTA